MEDLDGMISECWSFLVCIIELKINECSSNLWNKSPLFNVQLKSIFRTEYLHLPLTFLRWTILDQLALSTDECQLIVRRCH